MPKDRRIDAYEYKDFSDTGKLQKEYLGSIWLKAGRVVLGPGTEWNANRQLRGDGNVVIEIDSGEPFFNALKNWSNGYIGFEEVGVNAPIPEKASI